MQRLTLAFLLWLFVWPVATTLSLLTETLLPGASLPQKTLVLSAILVPTLVWLVVPWLTRTIATVLPIR